MFLYVNVLRMHSETPQCDVSTKKQAIVFRNSFLIDYKIKTQRHESTEFNFDYSLCLRVSAFNIKIYASCDEFLARFT